MQTLFNPASESPLIISFLKDIFTRTGKSTAVIGLSGGIDSAVSFALTIKALGPQNIHAYHLPSKTTNFQHLKDLQLLTSDLRLKTSHFHLIPINSIIQKSWRIIKHATPEESMRPPSGVSKLRLANLAARIRMMILFDQAKKHDALVIGTENKSETMLGYFTRFGDQASDLEPIAHLFKTQVIDLAKHLDLPTSIINKPPSADLWPGQTDAAELGFSYTAADPVLMQLAAGELPEGELAEKVISTVNKNAFKQHVPYTIQNLPF